MAINLTKGQRMDMPSGLTKIAVGLGWDPSGRPGEEFDLDASAFMLAADKQIPAEGFFVYYNTDDLISSDKSIKSSGDDRTGGSSDGDDETLSVDLTKVDPRIEEIIFTVTIHDHEASRQNFGQIRNSFIRIYDAVTQVEICKYELGEDFSVETAVEFGRLYKRGGAWRFEAMGIGYKGGLDAFVAKYAKRFV
jgi:tellurium resistance protein TerD